MKSIEYNVKVVLKGGWEMIQDFYFFTKNKEIAEKLGEYDMTNIPDYGYTIHFCRLETRWCPLFIGNNVFRSFADLEQFYNRNYKKVTIIDDCSYSVAFDDFKELVIEASEEKSMPYKWVLSNGEWNINMCTEKEAELWSPIDHKEYYADFKKHYPEFEETDYTKDTDYNFDWTWGDIE